MSVEEKRRELFEAWFKQAKPRVAQEMIDDDEFVVRWMFEAYCAALDAVVIELPERDTSSAGGPDSEMGPSYGQIEGAGYNYALDDCRTAIESTGLGLKVLP